MLPSEIRAWPAASIRIAGFWLSVKKRIADAAGVEAGADQSLLLLPERRDCCVRDDACAHGGILLDSPPPITAPEKTRPQGLRTGSFGISAENGEQRPPSVLNQVS
jgi:hypothetical protein